MKVFWHAIVFFNILPVYQCDDQIKYSEESVSIDAMWILGPLLWLRISMKNH